MAVLSCSGHIPNIERWSRDQGSFVWNFQRVTTPCFLDQCCVCGVWGLPLQSPLRTSALCSQTYMYHINESCVLWLPFVWPVETPTGDGERKWSQGIYSPGSLLGDRGSGGSAGHGSQSLNWTPQLLLKASSLNDWPLPGAGAAPLLVPACQGGSISALTSLRGLAVPCVFPMPCPFLCKQPLY